MGIDFGTTIIVTSLYKDNKATATNAQRAAERRKEYKKERERDTER
jgi:hypothetical protein